MKLQCTETQDSALFVIGKTYAAIRSSFERGLVYILQDELVSDLAIYDSWSAHEYISVMDGTIAIEISGVAKFREVS